MGVDDLKMLQESYRVRVNEELKERRLVRDSKWTESIAVGSERFVAETKVKLGIRGVERHIYGEGNTFQLREPEVAYIGDFTPENDVLSAENTYLWDDID